MSNRSGHTTSPIVPGRFPPAADLDWMRRMIEGARTTSGNRCILQPDGLVIPTPAPASYARPFQIAEVQAAAVLTRGGPVLHGTYVAIAEPQLVAVAGGTEAAPTYCVLQYSFGGSASILATTTVDFPTPATGPGGMTAWRQPLWSAYLVGSQVVIKEVLWEGMLILPGVSAL